ncbi:MAG: DNA cytosine methyltransferase [Pseudomonadales bacterium]|nr:DNA cytosine methyltransferase [Pseudomonadales bacterium]
MSDCLNQLVVHLATMRIKLSDDIDERDTMSFKRGSKSKYAIRAVDLFCGAGGLTRGLEKAGVTVAVRVDLDPACEYPFTANNKAEFLLKSVEELTASDLSKALDGKAVSLLAGCAPCQPFSSYSQSWADPSDKRWNLLRQFARLVKEVKPDLVTMENVPRLEKQQVFQDFISELLGDGFHVFYRIVNCADYGVPQSRQRLVLLASKLGPIKLIKPTRKPERYKTVREAIGKLPPLKAGEVCLNDPLHQASDLSQLNLKRIRASKPGGSWRDWRKHLVADCHMKSSGKTYPGVYGRMCWDEPSPTMTTQYYGYGNGRFGHPEQDRAISLREGAILQSFPRYYKFVPKNGEIYRKVIGRLIGNAVPVKLGEAIGKSIVRHVSEHRRTRVA